jgi:eukaryotic-like serine/threonine-protein kinase
VSSASAHIELEPAALDSAPSTVERLGAYELLIELAAGGMATVHLARPTDRREGPSLVAVKRPHRHLSGDKTFLTMLVDEARLASAIDHPNVVKVRELGFDGGIPFIVMDYVEGASLAELRRELSSVGRTLDVRVAVRIILDALAGLHAAHELRDDGGRPQQIVHRDVSPHNVLIGCDGRAHLTDFGIAQAVDRIQTTRTHEVKGKLAYLAPERVDKRRACTVQSDVFSMAVVLWECFAGRRLFRGEEAVDVLQEVMSGHIPTLRQVGVPIPPALDQVVAIGLSRDLETRHATALAFAQAIEHAAGSEHVGSAADVTRLMEAIFGARMAQRHDRVRATVGSRDLDDLLRESGLPARPSIPNAALPHGELLAELAPLAPTGRYALAGAQGEPSSRRARRIALWAGAVGLGIALGAAATLALVARSATRVSEAPSLNRSVLVQPNAVAALAGAAPRRILVRLPFAASHVVFDNSARDIEPLSDVVAFDVPAESAFRHRVAALAPDGTRADGYVRERANTGGESISSVDDEGYVVVPPAEPTSNGSRREPPVAPSRALHPIGKVRDGFTKLK